MDKSLFSVQGLCKEFKLGRKRILKAVARVSFDIHRNEILGIVGESGSGKSTVGRALLGLHSPTSGEVRYRDKNIWTLSKVEMTEFRKKAQMIFQDPNSCLNPRLTIEEIVSEGLQADSHFDRLERKERVRELLKMVGLNHNLCSRYPHEFSGGQKQRVGIARAIAVNPEFIVCDEPISALDVSIQAQIVNLLMDLKRELSLSYLFIAHDLSMVRHISDRVGVMYRGKLVEIGACEDVCEVRLHPYTKALFSASTRIYSETPAYEKFIKIGDGIDVESENGGCSFAEKCPRAEAICFEKEPDLAEVGKGHFVACHRGF